MSSTTSYRSYPNLVTSGALPTGAQTHTSARTIYCLDRGSDKIHSASQRGASQSVWLPLEELWAYAAANQELIIFPGRDQ